MIEIKLTGSTPLEALADMVVLASYIQDSPQIRIAADLKHAEEKTGEKAPAAAEALPIANVNPTVVPAVTPVNGGMPQSAPLQMVAPVPAPTLQPPVGQMAPVPTPMPAVPVAAAPAYTVEQLAHAGADFVMRNPARAGEAQQLLGRFGVQAVTDLKKERYGEFATALRGLGAQI